MDNEWIPFDKDIEFQYLSKKDKNQHYIAGRFLDKKMPKYVFKGIINCNKSKAINWGIITEETEWYELSGENKLFFSQFCQN